MGKERLDLLIGLLVICTWQVKQVCGEHRKLVHDGGLICESIFKKIQKTGFYAYEFTHLMCETDDNTHHSVLKRRKLGKIQHMLYKKEDPGFKNDRIGIPAVEKGKKWQKATKKYEHQHADHEDKEGQTSENKYEEGKSIMKKNKEGKTAMKFREEYRTFPTYDDEQLDEEKDKNKQPDQGKDKDKQPDKAGYPGLRKGKEKDTRQRQDGQRLSFIVYTVSCKINTLIRLCCIHRLQKTRVTKEGTGYIRLGSGENAINVKRYEIKKNWDQALRFCRAEKASLVKIDTKQKMEQIIHKLCKANDKFAKFYMWMGLKDFNGSNVFRWLDGSPSEFTYWHKKEPSHKEHKSGVIVDADCVAVVNFVWDGVFWDDLSCSDVNGFICERNVI